MEGLLAHVSSVHCGGFFCILAYAAHSGHSALWAGMRIIKIIIVCAVTLLAFFLCVAALETL